MATATLETDGSPAGLIRAINNQKAGTVREGVVLTHDRGVVLVKPLKKGTGIKILAEAVNAEIAREICADVEKDLRERMQ
jgi:mannose-1-phosphate guanylyltransferase/phosphomannomutase